jgi:hypothetical protein
MGRPRFRVGPKYRLFLDPPHTVNLGSEPGVKTRGQVSLCSIEPNRTGETARHPGPAADPDRAFSPATYCRPVAGLVTLGTSHHGRRAPVHDARPELQEPDSRLSPRGDCAVCRRRGAGDRCRGPGDAGAAGATAGAPRRALPGTGRPASGGVARRPARGDPVRARGGDRAQPVLHSPPRAVLPGSVGATGHDAGGAGGDLSARRRLSGAPEPCAA